MAARRSVAALRATDWGLFILLALFIGLATTYSIITPLFEAPDELWHYPFVKQLADGKGLPVLDAAHLGPWHQEGGQPPLYYALAALASRWAPSEDLAGLLKGNEHAELGVARPGGSPNILIHTDRERMPYGGAVLAVHLARGLSVLLGAATVLFVYGIGLEMLPKRPGLALAAAAVTAFTPMFLFLSGSVNNDNLVVTLSTATIWLLLRLLRLPPAPGRWALLGVLIGAAALSKVSGLLLLAPAGLVLAWVAWRQRDWKLLVWGGACVAGVVALVAGWWYWRNWRLYHDPLGLNVFLAIAGHRHRPTFAKLWPEWSAFTSTYWGVFGWGNVAAPRWFYSLLDGLGLVAAGGLLLQAVRRLRQKRRPAAGAAFRFALLAAWPLLVLASLVRYSLLIRGVTGRLLYPAVGCLSFFLVVGLASWLPGERTESDREGAKGAKANRGKGPLGALAVQPFVVQSWFPVVPGVALIAALGAWAPLGVIAPAYARPPLLTAAELATIQQQLDLSFDGEVELLGYRIGVWEVRPGQAVPVTLYWRAQAPLARDYVVFIHLLDEEGSTIGQCDVHVGDARFPTSLWRPGDGIAETYSVQVKPGAASQGPIRVEVGLCRREGGRRLTIRDRAGREVGTSVYLGRVALRAG